MERKHIIPLATTLLAASGNRLAGPLDGLEDFSLDIDQTAAGVPTSGQINWSKEDGQSAMTSSSRLCSRVMRLTPFQRLIHCIMCHWKTCFMAVTNWISPSTAIPNILEWNAGGPPPAPGKPQYLRIWTRNRAFEYAYMHQ